MQNKQKIPPPNANLRTIVDFYLNSPAFARLSASSQKDYQKHLSEVLVTKVGYSFLSNMKCQDIKASTLNTAYNQWLLIGNRTANYRKSVLGAAWKYSMFHDVMEHNPVSLIKTVSKPSRKVVWTKDQVKQFLTVAYSDFDTRSLGLIVHMAYDWGQRIGDMRNLTWDDLNLAECRVDMTQSKRKAQVHLPISKGLCAMLAEQKASFGFQKYVAPRPKPSGGAFVTYTKEHISNHINSLLTKANLPIELTAMDLRRTAVTEMLEGGVDIGGIMQVTGHVSPQSLKPYMVNTLSGATKALSARGNEEDD